MSSKSENKPRKEKAKSKKTLQSKKNTELGFGNPEELTILSNKTESIGQEMSGVGNTTNYEESSEMKSRKEPDTQHSNQTENRKFENNGKKETSFYLQIHHGNILHIFSTGLILPSKYVANRSFTDIQSEKPGYILLSKGIINDLQSDELLLELFLDPFEFEESYQDDLIIYIQNPIPISRIKSILVSDNKSKSMILTNAMVGNAGIIPDSLIVINGLPSKHSINNISSIQLNKPNNSLNESIKKFDRILGAVAYGRHTNLLYLNHSNEISNYSDHFLAILKSITDLDGIEFNIKLELVNYYKQLFGINTDGLHQINKWLFNRVNQEKNFLDSDTKEFENIFINALPNTKSKNDAFKIFKMLYSNIERRKVPLFVQSIKEKEFTYLAIYAFLRLYGNINSEDRIIARKEIPNLTSISLANFIFTLLGFFYGYTHLLNLDEKIVTNNKNSEKLLEGLNQPTLKLAMDNQLDYVIVEAIYQYAFRNILIPHIPPFIEKLDFKAKKVIKKEDIPNEYDFYQTFIGKTQIFKTIKKNESIKILQIMENVPELIPLASDLGLFCCNYSIEFQLMDSTKLFEKNVDILEKAKHFICFKKSSLIELIHANKLDSKELLFRLELNNRNNV